MSSLWTPDGERPVDRGPAPTGPDAHDLDGDEGYEGLTDEDRQRAAAMAAEVDEVRRQLASVPAAVVVANHAMGLFELAAIHLSGVPANFGEAQLAIDALGALVDGLEGRLGDNEDTLRDSLGQIRLAFVQLRSAAEGPSAPAAAAAGSADDEGDDDLDDD